MSHFLIALKFKLNYCLNSRFEWILTGRTNQYDCNIMRTSMPILTHGNAINNSSVDSVVPADVDVLYKPNIFQSQSFLIKLTDILKMNIFTCFCWASVENALLWCCASRSSLLYSGFRYTIVLPLQPYTIQLYTFPMQWLAFFLPWFHDCKGVFKTRCPLFI